MPWSTPTLKAVRLIVRDQVRANLPGAYLPGADLSGVVL